MKYIFVDGSYYIFFRFNALKNWWSLAKRDEGVLVPNENDEFKEKFRKTFAEKLLEIPKKLGIKKGEPYRIYVGQDCRQEKIWRMEHSVGYKDGRADTSVEGEFFAMVYNEQLFEKTLGEGCILKYPTLEADDVIAISAMHLCDDSQTTGDDANECFIVSSDGDYLQLCASYPRIHIYDLKFKNIATRDLAYSEPASAMRMYVAKCLCGDKSDNIHSAFPKCGKKTAYALAQLVSDDGDDKELVDALLKKGGEDAVARYKHNDLMMNFKHIPETLVAGFLTKYATHLTRPSSTTAAPTTRHPRKTSRKNKKSN